MRLTDAAADHIKAVMANADRLIAGIRVGVKERRPCAGMSYTMEYAEGPLARSTRWSRTRAMRILIDPARRCCSCSAPRWTTRSRKLSAQFVFNNPNQTGACGCGEGSVQLEPAKESGGADAQTTRRINRATAADFNRL